MRGLCVLFPGGQDWWFKRQFHHVPWDGLAFYDTKFPLFIFIAGVSFCRVFYQNSAIRRNQSWRIRESYSRLNW